MHRMQSINVFSEGGVMPQIPPPSQGVTATDAAEFLGMTRQQFYASGLAEWLDYWQTGERNPRMYSKAQLQQMLYWLTVRKGQIALGIIPANLPLLPPPYDGDLAAFVEADECTVDCPECGSMAVINPHGDDEKYWCSTCDAP